MQDASEIPPVTSYDRPHAASTCMTSGPSPDIGDLLREIDRDPMAVLWDGPSRLGHSHRTRAKVTDMIVFVLGRGTGRDFGESDPLMP